MQSKTTDVDVTDYQTQFYTYLGAMATYNVISAQSGNETEELSYDDFIRNTNKNIYDTAFSTWFILSSLIGMFGAENMVNTGMGVEQLGIFNKLTIIGLYDIDTLATVGTSNVDSAFVWKLVVLAAIAVVCYIVGAIKFLKKDLPL